MIYIIELTFTSLDLYKFCVGGGGVGEGIRSKDPKFNPSFRLDSKFLI